MTLFPTMKTSCYLLLAAAVILTGPACTTQSQVGRYVGDVGAVGVGYVAGDQLSNGNKAVAFGSGAVALGLKRFVENKSDQKRMSDLDEAFKRGMAQDAKLSYLAIQNSQKLGTKEEDAATDNQLQLSAIPISAPARTINGVRINPTVETIYITTK
jgi:hypothetical protein